MGSIIVTGAGGYLGTHVLSALRKAGHQTIGLARRGGVGLEVCDLLDARRLARLMDSLGPSKIVHCAWETPRDLSKYEDDAAAARGVVMLENLLVAAKAPVLLISSMTVYGSDNASRIYREEDAGQPETAYARSKWAAEKHLFAAGREGFAVRLPGLFGGGRQSGLVWNLMQALQLGDHAQLPSRPTLWAAMDVRDAARALVRLCEVAPGNSAPVNIGYRDIYSISRLVGLLDELTGRTTVHDIHHPDFAFDLSRARALGAAPHQTLRGACLRILGGDI